MKAMEEQKGLRGVTFRTPYAMANAISDILQWKPGKVFTAKEENGYNMFVYSHKIEKERDIIFYAFKIERVVTEKGDIRPTIELVEVPLGFLFSTFDEAVILNKEEAAEVVRASIRNSEIQKDENAKRVEEMLKDISEGGFLAGFLRDLVIGKGIEREIREKNKKGKEKKGEEGEGGEDE